MFTRLSLVCAVWRCLVKRVRERERKMTRPLMLVGGSTTRLGYSFNHVEMREFPASTINFITLRRFLRKKTIVYCFAGSRLLCKAHKGLLTENQCDQGSENRLRRSRASQSCYLSSAVGCFETLWSCCCLIVALCIRMWVHEDLKVHPSLLWRRVYRCWGAGTSGCAVVAKIQHVLFHASTHGYYHS